MIALYNLEPKYINIALEKINLYYKQRGELVVDYYPISKNQYDKIYCSSIFSWSDKSYVTNDMICGGSGFNLTTTLPKNIEKMKPKINIGFTTRGCIRNCSFCIVPKKEGNIKITGDIYDFWDRNSNKIIILDNNILAVYEHFYAIIDQIALEKLKVDFNQGLDCRLMTVDIAEKLTQVKYNYYRFSFDDMSIEKTVVQTIGILKRYDIKWSMWYVLVGFNTTYKEDLYRIELLKSFDQRVFVQRYMGQTNPFYTELAGWTNQHRLFQKYTFKDFLKKRNRNYERLINGT